MNMYLYLYNIYKCLYPFQLKDKCTEWSKWSECTGSPCNSGKTVRSKHCKENHINNAHYEYKNCKAS